VESVGPAVCNLKGFDRTVGCCAFGPRQAVFLPLTYVNPRKLVEQIGLNLAEPRVRAGVRHPFSRG